MVETVEDGTAASGTPSAIRIYIGGLGENVTADEVEKIFVSLGRVHSVELVRTNGRSFGYMDFEPQSDKSLAKLFSTYNGCKWKGGKLRLEKAKEHYLSRLRREWEADSVPSVPVTQDVETNNEEIRPKNLDMDSMKISIFVPKLKKVKLLPYKGSGKHKYSFQRVEVPSTLPLHFCDCEEHCGPSESANQTYLSALDAAAHEKELSIMHSVMNKLLKESGEKLEELGANPDVVELVENNVEEREDEIVEEVVEEVAEEESDEDEDLVINISSRISDESLFDFKVSEVVPRNQELNERKHQQSAENISNRNVERPTSIALEPTQDEEKPSTITTEKTTLDEFSSLLPRNDNSSIEHQNQPNDQNITEKSGKSSDKWFQKSAWRELVGDSSKNLFSVSSSTQPSVSSILSNQPISENKIIDSTITSRKRKVVSNIESPILTTPDGKIGEEGKDKQAKPEVRRIVQNQPNDQNNTEKSGKSSDTWFQKSAWRDLVGDSSKNLFSVSSSTQPNQPISENKIIDSTITSRKRKVVSNIESPILTTPDAKIGEEGKDKQANPEVRRIVQKVKVGEVCSFMKSAESEKEWNNTKMALSGYMKKKSDESSNGSGVRKGAPFHGKRFVK